MSEFEKDRNEENILKDEQENIREDNISLPEEVEIPADDFLQDTEDNVGYSESIGEIISDDETVTFREEVAEWTSDNPEILPEEEEILYKYEAPEEEKSDGQGYNFYSENVQLPKKKNTFGVVMGVLAGILAGVIVTLSVGGVVLVKKGIINLPERKNVKSDEIALTQREELELNKENSFEFSRLSEDERQPKNLVDIAAEVGPSVVMVTTYSTVDTLFGESAQQGSGSGIIISEDGYVITNNHVIEGADDVNVILSDGREFHVEVVGSDIKTDLAVLKMEGAEDLTVAVIGDSSKLQVGELAVAIGNPLGAQLTGTVTQGVISAVNRTIQASSSTYVNLIQTDAAINAGNSGGALVNGYGEVIGINTVKYAASGVEGIGFAIPVNDAMPIVKDLIENGYVTGRPLIGITAIAITPRLADRYDLPEGLYVSEVVPDSAADEGGVEEGDVIVKADGKGIYSSKELNELRDSKKVGDAIVFEIYRSGKNVEVTIHLKEDKSQMQPEING